MTQRVLFCGHYVGNKILTIISNVLLNLNLTDIETCHKTFVRILKEFELQSSRFGFETGNFLSKS